MEIGQPQRMTASAEAVGALADVPHHAQTLPARRLANTILGRVALWGKVCQGQQGWRGQYACRHLYLPRCFALDLKRTAERLTALYDMPAEVVPALGPTTFAEAAGRPPTLGRTAMTRRRSE
jgi:hypothetical protein